MNDQYLSLFVFLVTTSVAAVPGIVFRPGSWYQALNKPAWRPPDRVFGPVWLIVYVLIAISGWLVWDKGNGEMMHFALAVFGLQLILNGLWSTVFFGLRRPGWAFLEIIFLFAAIVWTVVLFHPINVTAAYLLLPYLLWVAFAAVLNFSVWRRNTERLSSERR